MASQLLAVRRPTEQEAKERGGEIVFVRKDESGKEHTIYGQQLYESWQQWGATTDILWDNCDDIEAWRHGQPIPGLAVEPCE